MTVRQPLQCAPIAREDREEARSDPNRRAVARWGFCSFDASTQFLLLFFHAEKRRRSIFDFVAASSSSPRIQTVIFPAFPRSTTMSSTPATTSAFSYSHAMDPADWPSVSSAYGKSRERCAMERDIDTFEDRDDIVASQVPVRSAWSSSASPLFPLMRQVR